MSEEDILLQERLDRLTLEIASMQKSVSGLHYPPPVAPSTRLQGPEEMSSNASSSSIPLLMVSGSDDITEESWEGEGGEKDLEIRGKGERGGRDEFNSNYLNLAGNSRGTGKYEFLGSCESLADSEGSLSPGQQSCCIIVVDHDKCLLSSPILKFNYEDDVFFT